MEYINNKCRCECKKYICEKYYIWNPATCSCKNGKYLTNIMYDSVITCDEIINADTNSYDKETKTVPNNIICETKILYILLVFLLVTIEFLKDVSIYCYLIEYKAKERRLLPFYVPNNELK